MKAVHSEAYWTSKWDEMINTRCASDLYMNLEAELAREMKYIDEGLKAAGAIITADQYKAIQRTKAQPIIEKATARCKEHMAVIKRINRGEAGLGYTTELQNIKAKYELEDRFEFNCFQLSVFRKKYGF